MYVHSDINIRICKAFDKEKVLEIVRLQRKIFFKKIVIDNMYIMRNVVPLFPDTTSLYEVLYFFNWSSPLLKSCQRDYYQCIQVLTHFEANNISAGTDLAEVGLVDRPISTIIRPIPINWFVKFQTLEIIWYKSFP